MRICAVLMGGVLLLSGCAYMGTHVTALKGQSLAGDDFPHKMAAEYLAYAEALADEGHPLLAEHFAAKGVAMLEKGTVAPEDKPALRARRAALLAVLTDDVKEVAPIKAARAQILFDCAAQGQSICKDAFDEALEELQDIAESLVHGEDNRFTITFVPGASDMTPASEASLDVIAKRVAGYGVYTVSIIPSVDAKGALALRRTLALEKALIVRGVDAGRIIVRRSNKTSKVALSIDDEHMDAQHMLVNIQTYQAPQEGGQK